MKMPKHPMQPLYRDAEGVIRFTPNYIVQLLLNDGKYDMNRLALIPFSVEDRKQFYQLIGYSVSGYKEIVDCDNEALTEADKAYREFTKRRKK